MTNGASGKPLFFRIEPDPKRCYVTGQPCTCGGFDVAADCPHDHFVYQGEEDGVDPDVEAFRRQNDMERE